MVYCVATDKKEDYMDYDRFDPFVYIKNRYTIHSDHNDVVMVPDVIFYDNPLVSESR